MAGPLFTIGERQHNEELVRALERRCDNATFILPQRMEIEQPIDYRVLVARNLRAVEAADVVVACLDGADADSGTCFEVGYARALDKTVIGYRTDLRESESDGVNAMLRYGCTDYLLSSSLKGTTVDGLAAAIAGRISKITE